MRFQTRGSLTFRTDSDGAENNWHAISMVKASKRGGNLDRALFR